MSALEKLNSSNPAGSARAVDLSAPAATVYLNRDLRATESAALSLAAAGYRVLPVLDNKHPACEHGYLDASADPAVVARMFGESRAPLVGVATGVVSGVAVLDLDGAEGLAWLEAHRAKLPATVQEKTRRGGRHLWFAQAALLEVPSTASKIAPNVDTRGDGGCCIAWDPAALLDRARMAPWPAWLSERLRPSSSAPCRPALRAISGADDVRRYAVGALRSAVNRVAAAREGTRNATLNRETFAVARLVGRGLAESEVRDALAVAARVAGLAPREIEATISSALRARGGQP